MKGSNGIRFVVAVIVGLISFFGLTSGIPLVACGSFYNEWSRADELSRTKSQNMRLEDINKGHYRSDDERWRLVEAEFNVSVKRVKYDAFCQPLEKITGDNLIRFSALRTGASYIVITLVIDGIVLGAYQFFGKSKEQRELVEKVRDEKES